MQDHKRNLQSSKTTHQEQYLYGGELIIILVGSCPVTLTKLCPGVGQKLVIDGIQDVGDGEPSVVAWVAQEDGVDVLRENELVEVVVGKLQKSDTFY